MPRLTKEQRESIKSFREHMLVPQKMGQVVAAFIEKSIEELREEGGENDNVERIIKFWLEVGCEKAVQVVDAQSRSPIERLFFNAFLLGLIKYDPMGFQFHGAMPDAPANIDTFSQNYEEMRKSFELYRRETGDIEGKDFSSVVDRMVSAGQMPEEAGKDLVSGVTLMYQMNMWNAMHFSLQPRFPGFGRRGRALTADLLMWIPGKPSVKVIVECDGFAYHSDREAFAADRRRDRVFQQHGYRVLRFPGTEIHADPIGMSAELFDALHGISGPKQYHELSFISGEESSD